MSYEVLKKTEKVDIIIIIIIIIIIMPLISLIDPCNLYFQGDILFALLVIISALPNVWKFFWLLFLLGFCTWSLSM